MRAWRKQEAVQDRALAGLRMKALSNRKLLFSWVVTRCPRTAWRDAPWVEPEQPAKRHCQAAVPRCEGERKRLPCTRCLYMFLIKYKHLAMLVASLYFSGHGYMWWLKPWLPSVITQIYTSFHYCHFDPLCQRGNLMYLVYLWHRGNSVYPTHCHLGISPVYTYIGQSIMYPCTKFPGTYCIDTQASPTIRTS